MKVKFGYLRETQEQVKKSPKDKSTGLPRTCVLDYLKVIFPNTDDWVHDKCVPYCESKCRPDYRSESLKLIIEIDGLPHYQKPNIIISDLDRTKMYRDLGYKVVRIPFFVQLTNKAVEQLFGVKVKQDLFPERVHSFTVEECATPAFMCPLGIKRCIDELKDFEDQWFANISYLSALDSLVSGSNFFLSVNRKVLDEIYSEFKFSLLS